MLSIDKIHNEFKDILNKYDKIKSLYSEAQGSLKPYITKFKEMNISNIKEANDKLNKIEETFNKKIIKLEEIKNYCKNELSGIDIDEL